MNIQEAENIRAYRNYQVQGIARNRPDLLYTKAEVDEMIRNRLIKFIEDFLDEWYTGHSAREILEDDYIGLDLLSKLAQLKGDN